MKRGSGLDLWLTLSRGSGTPTRRAVLPTLRFGGAARGDVSTPTGSGGGEVLPGLARRAPGGGFGSSPCCARIFSITGRSRTAAMVVPAATDRAAVGNAARHHEAAGRQHCFLAVTGFSLVSPKADIGLPDANGECQLPGAALELRCRPGAVAGVSRLSSQLVSDLSSACSNPAPQRPVPALRGATPQLRRNRAAARSRRTHVQGAPRTRARCGLRGTGL